MTALPFLSSSVGSSWIPLCATNTTPLRTHKNTHHNHSQLSQQRQRLCHAAAEGAVPRWQSPGGNCYLVPTLHTHPPHTPTCTHTHTRMHSRHRSTSVFQCRCRVHSSVSFVWFHARHTTHFHSTFYPTGAVSARHTPRVPTETGAEVQTKVLVCWWPISE